MTEPALDPLDLAALLCSRVCHDVISPVGAIINGLEVLDEEKDAEMRRFALDLIKKSAEQASAVLQFSRLAFGAAGSAGALIDTSDAEKVARGFFNRERTSLSWNLPSLLMSKNKVKLILNLCLIAAAAIPRGGIIDVSLGYAADLETIEVTAKGANARLAAHLPGLITAKEAHQPVIPQDVQAYYARLVAETAKMNLSVTCEPDRVSLKAESLPFRVAAAEAL